MLTGSILQKLTASHQNSTKPLNLGVYYKNTLVALCHALEDFILESETAPLVVTAFQRGKWYLQEAERYGEIAEKAGQILIMATPDGGFAEHPTSNRDNVALVSLTPDDPIAQEWHLMIISPSYTAMVLCQELSDTDYGSKGKPEQDIERKFYGFWTFEPELVRETVELAIAHIGQYNPKLQEKLTNQIKQIIAKSSSTPKDNLGEIVTKVVNYLQESQLNLQQPTNPLFSQALDDNLISNEMQAFLRIAQLREQADITNPNGAAEVAALAEAMGQLLDLPAWQIKRLKLASLLHRLFPPLSTGVRGDQPLSTVVGGNKLSVAQQETFDQQAFLPKASVLRIMPQLQAVVNIISHQDESWDGSGFPDGLAYDNIPLESRILTLIAYFQGCLINDKNKVNPITDALNKCKYLSGTMFDPKLVKCLELLVLAMEQGMTISVSQPKIAAGMWLIDNEE
jgi:DICT domain-containing protein